MNIGRNWAKGKTYEEIYGIDGAIKQKEKRSMAHKGYIVSLDTREKIRQANLGKSLTEEHKKKIGKANTGNQHTEEWKKKMSIAGKKNPVKYWLGKHLSKETRDKMRLSAKWGKDNPSWKGGITPLREKIQSLPEYFQWRNAIYERDNYTCQECGDKTGGNLNAHHNGKSYAVLLQEFLQEYDQFSPFEDQHTLLRLAMKWQPFWTAEGITYCDDCHTKKHKEISNASTTG